jgi:hypothetical protein
MTAAELYTLMKSILGEGLACFLNSQGSPKFTLRISNCGQGDRAQEEHSPKTKQTGRQIK